MSGRGRGKRSGNGPGPGRPPKYPNLNTEESEMNRQQPTGPNNSVSGNGGLVDILNQLDSNKRNEMLALVGQFKGRTLGLNDFMARARELLGERLFGQLTRDMNNASSARGSGIQNISNVSNPMIQLPPPAGLMPGIPGFPHQMRSPMNTGQMPMHSMPLIYGNQPSGIPLNPSLISSQYSILQTVPQLAATSTAGPIEVDVTKMDTSSLQDVMQYSGVDLKAEAELLYRENDSTGFSSGSAASVDHRLKFDYFFNPFKFRAIVQHALQRHFFSNTLNNNLTNGILGSDPTGNNSGTKLNKPLGITEEAVHLLGIAIQKRLIGILRRLSEISRHRVDYGRGRFKIKIENDPKKQIWLQEKLFIEGVGEEKRRANIIAGNSASSASTAVPAGSPNSNNPSSPILSGNQILLNPPTLATVNATAAASLSNKSGSNSAASKSGASASTSSGGNQGSTGGDETFKTKLANSTALAALGVRQKSWMSAASIGTSGPSSSTTATTSSSSSSSNQQQNSDPNEEKEAVEILQHPLASFYSLPSSTPLTDAELRAQYFNRTIAIVDLITCMETDSHLKRSKLLAILYEALPRENKEYSKESSNSANNNNNNNNNSNE